MLQHHLILSVIICVCLLVCCLSVCFLVVARRHAHIHMNALRATRLQYLAQRYLDIHTVVAGHLTPQW